MAIRTFLALDLDEPIRRGLTDAAKEFPADGSKIRWVAPENLHVTAKFLGDVADGAVAEVCAAVREAAGGIAPFPFDVAGLRCVPPGRKMRMIWADAHDSSGEIIELFGALEGALEPLGFPRERREPRPHITLARIKFTRNADGLNAVARRYAPTTFGTQRAGEVVVYQSQLTPQGAVYTPMARQALGPA